MNNVKNYATYKRRNAIIKANNPVASEEANSRIAKANNCPLRDGFLATPSIKAPKTTPIPTPAPINPKRRIPGLHKQIIAL